MKLEDFDFRVWVGGFAIANGEVWNGGYIDDSYMKKNQFNKVIAMGLVKFYDKNKEKLDDIEFFTFYNNVGFNHGVSNDIEIELWSGFYDCKGTKIYDGDIVKYDSNTRPLVAVFERSTFYIVDTSIEKDLQVDCGTRLQGIYDNRSNGYKDNKLGCLQVLGNIHESADLLKEKVLIKCKYGDMYDSNRMKTQDLAQYIINHSNKGFSNLELQKILYFVVLKHYKDTGEYLLDENFEAWQFGAIVYDVYLFYRDYGANSIDKTNENIEIEDSIKQRVDFVLSKLSNYNYWDLVDMLHAKGGAWDITYSKEKKGVIPRELIKKESFIIDQICKELKNEN